MGATTEEFKAELRAQEAEREAKCEQRERERQAERERTEAEYQRKNRRSWRILWTMLAVECSFILYLAGPTIIRVLIRATRDWQALLHSFPNP
jgi:hypothetical protein